MFGTRDALVAILALFGGGTVRTFEVLTPEGWTRVEPHRIIPGSTFRVRDDGVPVSLVPELGAGPDAYVAAQVQVEGVHFAVRLPTGETLDRVVALEAPD